MRVGMKGWLVGTLMGAAAALMSAVPAAAVEQGWVYIADDSGGHQFMPAPLGYAYLKTIVQQVGPNDTLNGPQDLFFSPAGNMYIADTGNNRIVETTLDGDVLKIIQISADAASGDAKPKIEGADVPLNQPQGVFVAAVPQPDGSVKDGTIYVADTKNKRIVEFNQAGQVIKVIGTPANVLIGGDFTYSPTKVVVDQRGYLYVINNNDYRGIVELDPRGDFRQFYARNLLGFNWRRFLIQLFATREQKSKLAQDLPPPHTNLFIDDKGFIYTCDTYSSSSQDQIKEYNAVGENVLPTAKSWGLNHFYGGNGTELNANFIDLAVESQNEIVTALDSATGFVYQYDLKVDMLLGFGGKGEEKGRFGFPSSVALDSDGHIYVLDKDRNNIQVFRPTEFAGLIHNAAQLYADGQYQAAAEPWRKVLQIDTNYTLAHKGLGMAYYDMEQWHNAAREFRLGMDRDDYSNAFRYIRHDFLRDHFGLSVLFMVLGLGIIWGGFKFAGWAIKQPFNGRGITVQTFHLMFNLLRKPYETFWLIKREKRGSVWIAVLLMFLAFWVRAFGDQLTSYQVADVDPRFISLNFEFMRIMGPWLLWALANYLIGAIFEGEAFFRDMVVGTAYALTPYLLLSWPAVLVTHVLARTEAGYYKTFQSLVMVGCGILIFVQLKATHNLDNKRTVGAAAASVFGMACIIFTFSLVYTLTDQILEFIKQVMIELTVRG